MLVDIARCLIVASLMCTTLGCGDRVIAPGSDGGDGAPPAAADARPPPVTDFGQPAPLPDVPHPTPGGKVTVTTDRGDYKSGEQPLITIHNGLAASIFLGGCGTFTRERLEAGAWVDKGPDKVCGWEGYAREVKAGEALVDKGYFGGGKWRVHVTYGLGCASNKPLSQAACSSMSEALSAPFGVLPTKQECDAAAKSYATAVEKAKACNTLINTPQCMATVQSGLWCGCQVHVASTATLVPLQQQWTYARCNELPPEGVPCPKCIAPGLCSGVCATPGGSAGPGTCQEDCE
jgi:hypothetical protein